MQFNFGETEERRVVRVEGREWASRIKEVGGGERVEIRDVIEVRRSSSFVAWIT